MNLKVFIQTMADEYAAFEYKKKLDSLEEMRDAATLNGKDTDLLDELIKREREYFIRDTN